MGQSNDTGSPVALTPATGLTPAEAAARLARDGFNDLPAAERRSALAIAGEVLREPMFALLLGAGVLYAIIGSMGEALVLFAFATVSVSIAMIQRGRSERVLDALRDLTSPRALVVRDGKQRRIPGREVVNGDLLIVTEGDRVPADALLISGEDLRVDESLLTGESVPVLKRPVPDGARLDAVLFSVVPGGNELPQLYSGTLVLRGTGFAVVTAIGAHSQIGQIGRSVSQIDAEPPRLQVQTRRLVLVLAAVGLVLSALAVVLYGLFRGDWLHALLGGIALGMSMLPEEFPLVLTVFLVMGAWRLSQSRVLTRRPAAIETLGAATVLCTDKTGTLTRNAMTVVRLRNGGEQWRAGELPARICSSPPLATLLETAVLASEPVALDPMERALHELATGGRLNAAPSAEALVHTYPLRRERLAIVNVWNIAQGNDYVVAAKGAPEDIAKLCRLDSTQAEALTASVDAFARQGIRVLGVARGRYGKVDLPPDPMGLPLQYLGLVGLADPLRDTVPEAVRECRSAGIRVIMITGDYPETARAIAREAGIDDGEVLSGAELDKLSDMALAAWARTATVFARITPQQKLRIVEALKSNGEVVAMTGDGVNDAPALKAAHIGIAMGGRGTDVARETASLVLLDDDFGSIVRAIRLGRRIYDNLRKAMGYILAIHIPIAGLALLPILLGGPLVLTPMLIALLELIIDPSCSIVLEAESEERNVMHRRPRDPRSPLFSRALATWGVLQGVLALVLVGGLYLYTSRRGMSQEDVRGICFVALVGVNLALVFVNRSFRASLRATFGRPNPSLWWSLTLVAGTLATLLAWPRPRTFFGLGPLHADDLGLCAAAVLVLLAMLQLFKLEWGRRLSA